MELVWGSLIIAMFITVFSIFFDIFYSTHITLLRARNYAYQELWKVNTLMNNPDNPGPAGPGNEKGIIYRAELMNSPTNNCVDCYNYRALMPERTYGLNLGSYEPRQYVHVYLELQEGTE